MATTETEFKVEGLCAGYGAIEVLHGVSLRAREGEAVGIFGRNGAGKSTLLEALAGILPAKRGRISLNGARMSGRPAYHYARQGVALVPQWRGLFPGLTTMDNLRLGCRGLHLTRAQTNDRLEGAFKRFPALVQRRDVRAGSLSGGEQQILAIAKALVREPSILLLDEPSIGLAPIIVDEVAQVIQSLRGGERLIIVSEQRTDWALDTVDRGYVIEGGVLVEELAPDDRASWGRRIEHYIGTQIDRDDG